MSLFSQKEAEILDVLLEQPEFICDCNEQRLCEECETYKEWERSVDRIRDKVLTASINYHYPPETRYMMAVRRKYQAERVMEKMHKILGPPAPDKED